MSSNLPPARWRSFTDIRCHDTITAGPSMREEHHTPVGKGLPPAVLDYLRAVLPGASEMPSKQRFCYAGEFREGGRGTWMRYRTLEEFSITHPAFDRITGARMGPLQAVQVVDRFDGY